MDNSTIQNHISLYVNDYSLDLGIEGKSAVRFLLSKGHEENLLQKTDKPIFI